MGTSNKKIVLPPSRVHVAKPFIYGTAAFYQGKKADPHKAYQWTVYVRDPEGADLSYFIQKVVFQLHESFEVPTRGLPSFPQLLLRQW